MGRVYTIIILAMLINPLISGAQIQEDQSSYKTEFIWGINKNTSSGLIGGLIFKHSTAIGDRLYRTIGLELINVKHPKEVRYNSIVTGNFFIWGKTNYLYALRTQYGRDLILFRKAPQQGVQITAMFAGGPTFGIHSPYYVEVASGAGGFETIREPFNPDKHLRQNIYGTGRLFQGVSEADLKIGMNLKTGISFEFGTFKSNVTGFEVGFLVDAYTEKIILVPQAENKAIYPTAFITLFYGSRN